MKYTRQGVQGSRGSSARRWDKKSRTLSKMSVKELDINQICVGVRDSPVKERPLVLRVTQKFAKRKVGKGRLDLLSNDDSY